MIYTDRNETDLYNCFSDEELKRLREIKSDPQWIPRQDRKNGVVKEEGVAQINVVLPALLKARVVEKCGAMGVTIRDYITAVLEATT